MGICWNCSHEITAPKLCPNSDSPRSVQPKIATIGKGSGDWLVSLLHGSAVYFGDSGAVRILCEPASASFSCDLWKRRIITGSGGSFEAGEFSLHIPTQRKIKGSTHASR